MSFSNTSKIPIKYKSIVDEFFSAIDSTTDPHSNILITSNNCSERYWFHDLLTSYMPPIPSPTTKLSNIGLFVRASLKSYE